MLRTFIQTTRTPERAELLIKSLDLIEKMGYLNTIDVIESIGAAEEQVNPSDIVAMVEDQIGAAIEKIYAAHSILIDYDPNKLQAILDLLQFLLTFNQEGGYTPLHLQTRYDLFDIGDTNEEILVNLYEESGHNYTGEPVEWISWVGIAFINNLVKVIEMNASKALVEEPSAVVQGELHEQIKKFSSLFPDSIAIKHFNNVGGKLCDINHLLFIYDEKISALQPNELAVELVGFVLISATPANKTKADFALEIIESVAGQNIRAMTVINSVKQTIDKVGLK